MAFFDWSYCITVLCRHNIGKRSPDITGGKMTCTTSDFIVIGITLITRSRFMYGRRPLHEIFTDDNVDFVNDRYISAINIAAPQGGETSLGYLVENILVVPHARNFYCGFRQITEVPVSNDAIFFLNDSFVVSIVEFDVWRSRIFILKLSDHRLSWTSGRFYFFDFSIYFVFRRQILILKINKISKTYFPPSAVLICIRHIDSASCVSRTQGRMHFPAPYSPCLALRMWRHCCTTYIEREHTCAHASSLDAALDQHLCSPQSGRKTRTDVRTTARRALPCAGT